MAALCQRASPSTTPGPAAVRGEFPAPRRRGVRHLTSEDEFRWAEALAIERMHGADAPRWVAERIGALALAGDREGVERFRVVAARLDELLRSRNVRPS